MSETSEGRLYEVAIKYRVMVFAESERDARIEATSAIRDEDPGYVSAIPVTDKTRLGVWADSAPYGAPDDFTCTQILDGVHLAPLPEAPPSTLTPDTAEAWLAAPHRVPETFTGDDLGAGWAWWTNGQAALGVRCGALGEEIGRAAKIRALVESERPHSADFDAATFDALAPVDRNETRVVQVGPWHLSPLLLRAFVWGPMRAAGDTSVRVEWGTKPADFAHSWSTSNGLAVVFFGSTWAAIVMPLREPDDLDAERIFARFEPRPATTEARS